MLAIVMISALVTVRLIVRAATTIYRNRRILSRLEQWAAHERGLDAEHVSPMQMNQYVNSILRQEHDRHAGLSSVSCHGHLGCIRAAFQWALDVDLVEGKNPCRRVKVDVRRKPQRFFTNAELRSILAACVTEREYLATTILMLSGLRLFELAALRWERTTGYDRRGDQIQLPWAEPGRSAAPRAWKGRTTRAVPIHPILMPLLVNARHHTENPYVLGNSVGWPAVDIRRA
jgi:integrase